MNYLAAQFKANVKTQNTIDRLAARHCANCIEAYENIANSTTIDEYVKVLAFIGLIEVANRATELGTLRAKHR